MRVTFWGVRGTFPATGAAFARYGGDTMCIEVVCGGARLILDAGSGLRALGAELNAHTAPTDAHIILSHLHLDHVMGLPHFAPFLRHDTRVQLHALESLVGDAPHDALFSVLRPPLFPLDAGKLPAAIGLNEYVIGEVIEPEPGVRVHTLPVSHQGDCAGLVVEHAGRRLAYITDHEHGSPVDDLIAEAVEGADLLIYDATYTDEEMPAHRGWGHSSWQAGVELKRRAGVQALGLAHHEPDRTDAALDRLSEAAVALEPDVFFARQRMVFDL